MSVVSLYKCLRKFIKVRSIN